MKGTSTNTTCVGCSHWGNSNNMWWLPRQFSSVKDGQGTVTCNDVMVASDYTKDEVLSINPFEGTPETSRPLTKLRGTKREHLPGCPSSHLHRLVWHL